MALTFWIIGRKVRRAGEERNLVTPPELVKNLYQKRIGRSNVDLGLSTVDPELDFYTGCRLSG